MSHIHLQTHSEPDDLYKGLIDGDVRKQVPTTKRSRLGIWIAAVVFLILGGFLAYLCVYDLVFARMIPKNLRNEDRARDYAQEFYEIGPHQVGSAANAAVRNRLLAFCQRIASSNENVECDIQTRDGTQTHGLDPSESWIYGSIGNVLMRFRNRGTEAVMLTAHYDSSAYSPGTSDDLLGVVSLMEFADRYVESYRSRTDVDVVIAFTNAEEARLTGADALLHHSWASREYVIFEINLDSGGGGGIPILFSYSSMGYETLKLWSEAGQGWARGSPIAQDASRNQEYGGTDFEGVLGDYYPGLSIIFSGKPRIYHTRYDNPSSIVNGTYAMAAEFVNRLVKQINVNNFEADSTDVDGTYLELPIFVAAPIVLKARNIIIIGKVLTVLNALCVLFLIVLFLFSKQKALPFRAFLLHFLFICFAGIIHFAMVTADKYFVYDSGNLFPLYALIGIGGVCFALSIPGIVKDVPLELNIAAHFIAFQLFGFPWVFVLNTYPTTALNMTIIYFTQFIANIVYIFVIIRYNSENDTYVDTTGAPLLLKKVDRSVTPHKGRAWLLAIMFLLVAKAWILLFWPIVTRVFEMKLNFSTCLHFDSFSESYELTMYLLTFLYLTLPFFSLIFALLNLKHCLRHFISGLLVLFLLFLFVGISNPFSADHPAIINPMVVHYPNTNTTSSQVFEMHTFSSTLKKQFKKDVKENGLSIDNWNWNCGSPSYLFDYSIGENIVCYQNQSLTVPPDVSVGFISETDGIWAVNVSAPESIGFTMAITNTRCDGPTIYQRLIAAPDHFQVFTMGNFTNLDMIQAKLFVLYDGTPWHGDYLPDWASGKALYSSTVPVTGYALLSIYKNGTVIYENPI